MIKFEEALRIVLENTLSPEESVVKLEDSYGRVLYKDVYAERDMPPFDKSAVDGYALKREEIGKPLTVLENIQAGYAPAKEIVSGTCSKIMTGAMVPAGADFVIMVEDTLEENGVMRLREPSDEFRKRNNICYKGEDIKKDDTLLKAGTIITAAETAILASSGYSVVSVSKVQTAGILSTGDEIVEPHITPSVSQIRNSNGWQLRAQAIATGANVRYYGIVSDNRELLKEALGKATDECDITIITGGVSAGDFDYVPEIIKECGFEILFNKVAVQPGKPSTFAVKREGSGKSGVLKVIFALPGNPVSSLIQFEMLIKPYIIKSMGGHYLPLKLSLPAAEDFKRKNAERLSLIPVVINSNGTFSAVRYNGSAHITAMAGADAIAEIPEGVTLIAAGERATLHLFR